MTSYAWNFGDQTSAGSGKTPSHTYAAGGTYQVTLTVTDNVGGTATKTNPVTVSPANVGPTAAFSSSATELSVSFDASASVDTDGTIASYAWNFGDGSAAGSGRTPSHSFPAAGTYQVKLTVTDDDGATDSLTKPVSVSGPLARDNFGRTSATGWGNAEVGGAWSYVGTTDKFAVNGNAGQIKISAGTGPMAKLGVSSTDTDLQFTFSFDQAPTGGGQFVRAHRAWRPDQCATRRRSGYPDPEVGVYKMTVYLVRVVNGAETVLGTKVLTGTFVQMRPTPSAPRPGPPAPLTCGPRCGRATDPSRPPGRSPRPTAPRRCRPRGASR